MCKSTGRKRISAVVLGFGLLMATGTDAMAQFSESIEVCANQELPAATVMNVVAGFSYRIEASGTWTSGGFTGGPEGDGVAPGGGFLLPTESAYSLIARIGAGDWFFVGTDLVFDATASGPLEFSMNDVPGLFGDNSGCVTVQITETLVVCANVQWSGTTGGNVVAGTAYQIIASGTWTSGAFTGGPEGDGVPPGGGFLLPTESAYSLIARIGAGDPFFVGTDLVFIASVSGPLDFSMNDVPGNFGDNSGCVSVEISEYGQPVPTASAWGLMAMALMILTGGTLVYWKRESKLEPVG